MSRLNAIRADFSPSSFVVYGAYSDAIADAALEAKRFVPPFSLKRMTWIKPSLLWLMHRSNWAQKSGQTRILRVAIARSGWDEALSLGVLTSFEAGVHANSTQWRRDFEEALVHVQWDPERSLRGADLGFNSIQVGLSRHVIERFVDEWALQISDITPLARKIHALLSSGRADAARKLLPPEKLYSVDATVARRLNMS
jgi:hypothetical protein